MKKIIFSLLVAFTLCSTTFAAEPGSDWFGQNGIWSSDVTTNALLCDATANFGGANNWIATTFGTAGPWKDLTYKFDFFMPNTSSKSLVLQFGQTAGDWANGGVKINFNIYGVFAYNPGYAGEVVMLNANYGSPVYSYKLDGWNTAVVSISAAGVVSVKLNGVNGGTTFTPANAATLDGEFCSVNYQYAAGVNFQMRNVEFTKAGVTKKYFTCTPTAYTNMNMFSTTNAWYPITVAEAVGPDNTTGGWYTVTTPGAEKITYDGAVTAGQTGIRTEKAALADEWWGTTIKFKTEIPAAGNTTIKVGSNGIWGNKCIMIEVNKYAIQVVRDHIYDTEPPVQLWAWDSATPYAPYTSTGPFDFEINISDAATNTISVKINGVVAPATYTVSTLGKNRLNTNGPIYLEVFPAASPFVFSNVEIKKAGVAKTYFPTVTYAIAATANDAAKGAVTGAGTYQKTSDVTLVATPTTGNKFVNWTEGATEVSTNSTYNFTASAARTLVANFVVDLGTGLNQSKNINLSVYPSPSNGNFTIASDAVGRKFQVTNLLGQNVKSGIINSSVQKLDLTNESAGNYFITVEGENGKVVKSIIKN